MMIPPQPQRGDSNLLASTKAMGNNFKSMVSDTVSPLTGLLGIGQQKSHPPPQYRYPVLHPHGVPQSPVQAVRAEAAVPVRVKTPQISAPCPPDTLSKVSPSAPAARLAEPEQLQDLAPPKPMTVAKKPKRIIDVDDDEDSERGMIQSANFVTR